MIEANLFMRVYANWKIYEILLRVRRKSVNLLFDANKLHLEFVKIDIALGYTYNVYLRPTRRQHTVNNLQLFCTLCGSFIPLASSFYLDNKRLTTQQTA